MTARIGAQLATGTTKALRILMGSLCAAPADITAKLASAQSTTLNDRIVPSLSNMFPTTKLDL